MAGQNETCGKADTEGDYICANPGGKVDGPKQMDIVFMKNETICKIVYEDIEYGIRPAASEVSKGLGRNKPGKWPVKKINKPDDDISDFL